jgi:hypothetical protein
VSLINPATDLPGDAVVGKFFVATVVGQPAQGGPHRVRIKVPDLMSEYADADCPWAAISRPVTRGAGGSVGTNAIPRNGSKVLVVFDAGDVNSPVILGELGPAGANPNHYGWSDENGNSLWFDVAAQTFVITNAGATIAVNGSGKVTITAPGGITLSSNAAVSITSTASIALQAPQINLN